MTKRIIYILFAAVFLIGCKTQTSTSKGKAGELVREKTRQSEQFLYYYYAAINALNTNDYSTAMASLLFCQQLDPTDAAVQQELGYMYQGLSQDSIALLHYKRAYLSDPISYWENYATMLYRLKTDKEGAKETIDILKEVIEREPKNIDALEALSGVYQQEGELKKALLIQDKIENTEGLNPYNVSVKYNILISMGQYAKAIDVLEQYLKTEDPSNYRLQAQIGDTYLMQGKTDKALQAYQAEAQRHPENPYNLISLSSYYRNQNDYASQQKADLYLLDAMKSQEMSLTEKIRYEQQRPALYQSKDSTYDFKERLYKTYIKDYPQDARSWAILANYYLSKQRDKDAIPLLYSELAIESKNSDAWDKLFEILQKDSTTHDTIYSAVINQAYEALPKDMKWCYWKSRVLTVGQQNDSAIAVLKNGIQYGETHKIYLPALWTMLGDIYTIKQEWDSVFSAYDEALKYDNKNTYILNNYAYMLALHGNDIKRAERMSQITIEEEPDNATFLDTYAWILHLQGQNMLAKFYMQRALDRMSNEEINDEITEHYKAIFEQ